MTREKFLADDRFCTLDDSDLACHGGNKPRHLQKQAAVEWLLDPQNSTAFCAVLDEDDDTVATRDAHGNVVWIDLRNFVGNGFAVPAQ